MWQWYTECMKSRFFTRPIFYIPLLMVFVVGIIVFTQRNNELLHETEVVARGTIREEVTLTGRVVPSQKVELAFERAGRVSRIYGDVGDTFPAQALIAELDYQDISAQLLQANANVSVERSRLEELLRGLRPEERESQETRVRNAERTLSIAEEKQITVFDKTKRDMEGVYIDALATVKNAAVAGKDVLLKATEIQYLYFNSYSTADSDLAYMKEEAVRLLFSVSGAGRWSVDALSILDGGVYGNAFKITPDNEESVEEALKHTQEALLRIRLFVTSIPVNTLFSDTEKTTMSTLRSVAETHVESIANAMQRIKAQRIANENALAIARAEVTSAQNALEVARSDRTVATAGTADEQVRAQESRVESALANVANLSAQIEKMVIRAPFEGTLTKNDAVLGEIISPHTPYFGMIGTDIFQIEAYIPEADIAKVALGNTARVTFDAYGRDEFFNATLTSIAPAETIIDGVATYKITLKFIEPDERIRSGMTTNIDIITAEKSDVFSVPLRSVVRQNDRRFVRVLGPQNEIEEVEVTTGLRGIDGRIEIISGLVGGERVVTYFIE